MKLDGSAAPHLTYCTNIHPGESWAEVRANLERHVLAVRRKVAPDRPFGVGLRLSGAAARDLAEGDRLMELRAFLEEHQLYIFTINGFPYGTFHGQPVKEAVYRPDWGEEERLAYTDLLATLLESLLPAGIEGSISTVPVAFAPRVASPEDLDRMSARIVRHVAHLHGIFQRSGKRIVLTLEPEPCCHLETVGDTISFFQERLFGKAAVEILRKETGLSPEACERLLRDHLGVCLDACHMAVEFEEPTSALRDFHAAGIRIGKVQISAGLRVRFAGEPVSDGELLRQLRAFADPVYLHQVVEKNERGIRRFLDLPDALGAARAGEGPREWRIHFHVPLFREKLGVFESTQSYVAELIRLLMPGSAGAHWEVETYTWDVLPEEHRGESVDDAVARELLWVIEQTERWAGEPT